jgi:hypothetical protein
MMSMNATKLLLVVPITSFLILNACAHKMAHEEPSRTLAADSSTVMISTEQARQMATTIFSYVLNNQDLKLEDVRISDFCRPAIDQSKCMALENAINDAFAALGCSKPIPATWALGADKTVSKFIDQDILPNLNCLESSAEKSDETDVDKSSDQKKSLGPTTLLGINFDTNPNMPACEFHYDPAKQYPYKFVNDRKPTCSFNGGNYIQFIYESENHTSEVLDEAPDSMVAKSSWRKHQDSKNRLWVWSNPKTKDAKFFNHKFIIHRPKTIDPSKPINVAVFTAGFQLCIMGETCRASLTGQDAKGGEIGGGKGTGDIIAEWPNTVVVNVWNPTMSIELIQAHLERVLTEYGCMKDRQKCNLIGAGMSRGTATTLNLFEKLTSSEYNYRVSGIILLDPVPMGARPMLNDWIKGVGSVPIIINYYQSLDRRRCGFTTGRPITGTNVVNIHTRRADDHAKIDIVHQQDVLEQVRAMFSEVAAPADKETLQKFRDQVASIEAKSQELVPVDFEKGKICPEPEWGKVCGGFRTSYRSLFAGQQCKEDAECDNFGLGCLKAEGSEFGSCRPQGGSVALGGLCDKDEECKNSLYSSASRCADVANNKGRCVPLNGKGIFGEYCHHDDQCQSGECLCEKDGHYCVNWREKPSGFGFCK